MKHILEEVYIMKVNLGSLIANTIIILQSRDSDIFVVHHSKPSSTISIKLQFYELEKVLTLLRPIIGLVFVVAHEQYDFAP